MTSFFNRAAGFPVLVLLTLLFAASARAHGVSESDAVE